MGAGVGRLKRGRQELRGQSWVEKRYSNVSGGPSTRQAQSFDKCKSPTTAIDYENKHYIMSRTSTTRGGACELCRRAQCAGACTSARPAPRPPNRRRLRRRRRRDAADAAGVDAAGDDAEEPHQGTRTKTRKGAVDSRAGRVRVRDCTSAAAARRARPPYRCRCVNTVLRRHCHRCCPYCCRHCQSAAPSGRGRRCDAAAAHTARRTTTTGRDCHSRRMTTKAAAAVHALDHHGAQTATRTAAAAASGIDGTECRLVQPVRDRVRPAGCETRAAAAPSDRRRPIRARACRAHPGLGRHAPCLGLGRGLSADPARAPPTLRDCRPPRLAPANASASATAASARTHSAARTDDSSGARADSSGSGCSGPAASGFDSAGSDSDCGDAAAAVAASENASVAATGAATKAMTKTAVRWRPTGTRRTKRTAESSQHTTTTTTTTTTRESARQSCAGRRTGCQGLPRQHQHQNQNQNQRHQKHRPLTAAVWTMAASRRACSDTTRV